MTNTITHEGVEYRKVERTAEIGEKIIITNGYGWYDGKVGEIYNVINPKDYNFSNDGYTYVDKSPTRNTLKFVDKSHYHVLEPIETEGTPVESPQDVIELLVNISRRLFEAERQLKSQAYEINELYKAVSR